jgi:threonine dehydrogenase-like Zn-dependent dehydrogenase
MLSTPKADVPKPKILEDGDVILKVTGSTVCGSDLHLLHGRCYFIPIVNGHPYPKMACLVGGDFLANIN